MRINDCLWSDRERSLEQKGSWLNILVHLMRKRLAQIWTSCVIFFDEQIFTESSILLIVPKDEKAISLHYCWVFYWRRRDFSNPFYFILASNTNDCPLMIICLVL